MKERESSMADWKAELAARFDRLGKSAAAAPETLPVNPPEGLSEKVMTGLRGVKCVDGAERIVHNLIQPSPCPVCGEGESGRHTSKDQCIMALKSQVRFLSGGVLIVRR
jgi:hypothetical protein